MMELHDVLLSSYSNYVELDDLYLAFRADVKQKSIRFNVHPRFHPLFLISSKRKRSWSYPGNTSMTRHTTIVSNYSLSFLGLDIPNRFR